MNEKLNTERKAEPKTDVSGSFLDFDDSKKEISLFTKIFLYIFFFPTIILVKGFANNRKRENKALKQKLRYFNPIIKQGFWSNSVTWVGRDKPLTDDELDNLCNYR